MKNNNSSTFLPPPPPAYPGSQGQCFAADPQFGCDAQHKAKQEEHQRYYQRTLNFQQRQMSSAKSATTVRYRFNPYSSDSAIVPAQSEPSGICGLHCEPHTHTPFVPQDVRLGSDHNSQLPPPHYDGAAASVYQQQLPYSHQHQHHQMDPYEHYNFQEEHHHQQQLHHLHHLQESRQERYHYHQVHPYLPQYDHEYLQEEEEPQQYYQHHHPHHEQYQLQHLQHLQERRQQRYHYHQVHQYDHQYPPELPPPYHQQQQHFQQQHPQQQPLQQQWSPQPPAPPAVAVIDPSVLGSIVGAGWPVIRPCDAIISPPTAASQQQDNTNNIRGTEGSATNDNGTSGANDDNVSGGGPIAAGPNIGSGGGGGRGDVVVLPPSSEEEGARVGIPLPPSTIHRSLYGRATLVPYPQKEFHAPAENEPPEVTDAAFAAGAVVRVFIGQLPYFVTDMQLNWICHTFGAGCLVHYCERITKRHVHTGEVGPTGCVHAVCPAESAAALCAHLTKKLLIDDSGVWIATNHSEAQALSEHVLRLKTDRSMRVPQRPYDTVVFQLAKSVGPMRCLSDSSRRACGGLDAELPPTYQQSQTAAAAATAANGNSSKNNGPLPPYRLAVSDLLCDEEEGEMAHGQRRRCEIEEDNDEEARSGDDSPLSNNTACPSDKQQIQSASGNNKSNKKSNKKHRRTNTAPPPPATVLPRGRTPATQPSSPQNANVPLAKAGGPITPTTSLPPKALSALIAQQQQQQHNAKSNSTTEAHTTPVSGASVPPSFPPHLSMAGRCFAPSSGPSCEPQYSHDDDSSALPSTAYIIRSGPTVSPTGAVNGLFPTVQ